MSESPAPPRTPGRVRPWLTTLILAVVLLVLVGGSFASGALADRAGLIPGHQTASEPASISATFSPFWEAWRLVQEHYVDQFAIDPQSLTYGAIGGMLQSLGDVGHTRFLTPDEARAEQQALSGSIQGIGAEVQMRGGVPVIVAPLPDSPAERAGIRPGDVIHAVDGQLTAGLTIDQVVNLVRGTPGTSVTLTVVHPGDSSLRPVTIVREEVSFPLVTWTLVPGTTIAHVLISSFGDHATDQLVTALRAAEGQGATGVVLDLRNDPGGLLSEAVGVASQFVSEGNALLEQDASGKRKPVALKKGGVALQIPVVVLVNEGTASASEVTAGALRDHDRAQIVGTKTFGTGTVLSSYTLSDGSEVLLGTEEWLTPNGNTFWKVGIEPDVIVDLPANGRPLTPLEEHDMSADAIAASTDAQLRAALDVLQPGVVPAPPTSTPTPTGTAAASATATATPVGR